MTSKLFGSGRGQIDVLFWNFPEGRKANNKQRVRILDD
jgi:hypothetical protein